jgi:hypothetical protein
MIILYSVIFLLVPIALGLLLWQCFRAETFLKAQKDLRLIQLRQISRQLRAQRQDIELLHADMAHFKLPLPAGKVWWLLDAIFKAFKVKQLRKMGTFNVSSSVSQPKALLTR